MKDTMKTCKDFGDELCAGCSDPMSECYPEGEMCYVVVYSKTILAHKNCCSSPMLKQWIIQEANKNIPVYMRCLRRALELHRPEEVATLDKIMVLL